MMADKPQTLEVQPDNIPAMLKALPRWVMWDWELRGDSWTKVPKNPRTNTRASTKQSSTWVSFDQAVAGLDDHDGFGIVLPDGIVGADFDDCLDEGTFDEQSTMFLAMMPTYAEVSPSGTGVKLLAAGHLDDEMRKISHGKGVELYDGSKTNRFFTLTGNVVDIDHMEITSQRNSLHAIQAMISEPKKDRHVDENDPEKVQKALQYLDHLDASRCEEYTEWLSVGMALHWCDSSDDMLEHWCEWSRQSSKFDESVAHEKWESFGRNNSERVLTLSHLRRLAKEDGYDPDRWTCEMISGSDLWDKQLTRDYLIEDFMVRNEPMIIGGASKTLKTTTALDMAVSISTGTDFLGKFRVPKKERVLFVSGESGELTLQENMKLIADARGLRKADMCDFFLSTRLPNLTDSEIVDYLIWEVTQKFITVLMVDPLYRSLRVGDAASNVFAMGEKLELVAERIHRARLTTVLCHHFKKQGKTHSDAPELEDLSQSGVAEFGRQFLLLKRREAYKMDGKHTLWFNWGGSAGHQGLKMLEADTGTRLSGVKWEHNLRSVEEWESIRKEMKDAAKTDDLKQSVISYVSDHPGSSGNAINKSVSGGRDRIKETLEALVTDGVFVKTIGARKSELYWLPEDLEA